MADGQQTTTVETGDALRTGMVPLEMFKTLMNRASQPGGLAAFDPRAVSQWTTVSQELVRFSQHRLKADMTTMQSLPTCRTPQDALGVWSGAVSQYLHDYADLFDRLVAINAPEQADDAPD